MFSIERSTVPANTMLSAYSMNGAYADCYTTELTSNVTFPEFVFAFYTTFLFKLERFILKWTVAKPSTDAQVRQLADNIIQTFAAWHIEKRSENEILMCDFLGRTRSWLMVTPLSTGGGTRTRLYFGSAVVPNRGKSSREFGFRVMLFGFHQIYSVLLLYAAKLRITRRNHVHRTK